MAFAQWNAARASDIIEGQRHLAGATLPIMHSLQREFGYVDRAALPLIAEALNLSIAEVHGVLTFYHDFRQEPPGRHVAKLCRAEACQAVGANELSDHVKQRLGVDWHGTTADGAVTLEPVFCLGLCACGPAALLDDEPVSGLDPAGFDAFLAEARA